MLHVDVLKVDKTFVDRVFGPAAETSLVEAILAMSRSMRLITVAEGVEQPEQAAWLQQARCSMSQGFLWSQPVDLFTAREVLATGTHRQPARGVGSAPVASGDDDGLLALS